MMKTSLDDPNKDEPRPTGTSESRRLNRKRTILTSFAALALAAAFSFYWLSQPQDVHASREGRKSFSGNPAINDGQDCSTCHGLGDGETPELQPVEVTIDGPTMVTSGETVRYTTVISGGPGNVGGIGVSVGSVEGTLIALENNLQILSGELTHRLPQAFSGDGTLRFSYEWTAPSNEMTLTMYAAAVSGDNSNDPVGDLVGQSSFEITVSGPAETPEPTATPTPAAAPASVVQLVNVADGLTQPVDVQNAGDERLFIVEQPGRIRIMASVGNVLDEPFLDIESAVDDSGNEMGLLGLAFHPDYANNGYFFVNYTIGSPRRTRISRFQVSSNANLADADSETILMEFTQPNINHNGGQVAFGPDGYLYISTGDGGGGGDPDRTGQDNGQLLGKILRIDVNQSGGTAPDCRGITVLADHYTIPADNPMVDGNTAGANVTCDEIWSTGLRNPWRFSFDNQTGDMWIGDVGQNEFEEIDFQPANSSGGENYGWRCYEADEVYRSDQYYLDTCGDEAQYVFPVYLYGRSQGCSVTGGIVYRGNDYPGLYGQYIFADFCTASLWSLRGDAASEDLDFAEFIISEGSLSSPSSFGVDHRGELYVASRGGRVYQITAGEPAPTATPTPILIPTATEEPDGTSTPEPQETGTPEPQESGTPEPQETETATPEPSPTGGSMIIPDPVVSLESSYLVGAPDSQFTFTARNLKSSVNATISLNGVELGTVPTDAEGTAAFILNTEALSDGVYVIRIQTEEDYVSARIVLDDKEPSRTAEDDSLQFIQASATVQPASEMLLPFIVSP